MGDSSNTGVLTATTTAMFRIPPFDPATGHLPPGRYRTTLPEIHERFVRAPEFQLSSTREEIWTGFTNYLQAWKVSQAAIGQDVLKVVWVGGSFTSSKLDPDDIDISPVYSETIVDDLHGTLGMKSLKKLIGNRTSITKKYRVEPFPIPWRSLESTLNSAALSGADQAYLAKRGGLDDWWQRVRPPGPKSAPIAPVEVAARGYLEFQW